MKKACTGLLVALAISFAADGADAQGRSRDRSHRDRDPRSWYNHRGLPLAFEARLDAGIPVGDESDGLDAGLGWGLTGALELTPTFSVYAGYSRFDFELEDTDVDVQDDGLDVGARVSVGTGGGFWNPYVQFGALFHDDETGFEAGLGGDYSVGSNLAVTPLVRYRNIDDFQYVSLGMGLNIRL